MNAQVRSLSANGINNAINGKAVIMGLIITLAITAILNLFGLGSGLVAFGYDASGMHLGVVGFAWLLISSALATFFGAWTSAYFSDPGESARTTGIVHGIGIWAATSLATFIIASTAVGAIVSGTGTVVKNIVSATGGQTQMNLTAQIDAQTFDQIKNTISDRLNNIQVKPEQIQQISNSAKSFLTAPSDEQKNIIRSKLADSIAQNSNISSQEANQLIDDWAQTYQDLYNATKQKVQAAAATASKAGGSTLLALFFVSLVSLFTAIGGGILGINRRMKA